jgi:serine/threonine protein kinase
MNAVSRHHATPLDDSGVLDRDSEVIRPDHCTTEDALADLIESDGRSRLQRGLECSLARYLDAIPDLTHKPVAIDAAIDIALRSLTSQGGSGMDMANAVRTLIASHPSIAEQIQLASTLSLQIGQTRRTGSDNPSPASRVGRKCGPTLEGYGARYTLDAVLGTGSNGAVYRATDRLLSDDDHRARVAIKFLHKSPVDMSVPDSNSLNSPLATSFRRIQARLLDEARRTRRVNHPNVLRVLDFGVADDDGAFVVSELIEGESLQDRVERVGLPVPPKEAARIIAQVARGVEAAHKSGILHCDLKPSNILISSDGCTLVADFGAATVLFTGANEQVAPLGNVAFAAPEQFRRETASLGETTDVYALGGILSYLISGEYPNGSTLPAIYATHHDPVHSHRSLLSVRGVDKSLDAVCRKALAPDPVRRYSRAGALADDLESWLASRPVAAHPLSHAGRARLFVKRNPLGSAVTIASLLAISTFAGYSVLTNRALSETKSAMKVESEKSANAEAKRQATLDAIKALYTDLKKRPKSQAPKSPTEVIEFLQPLADVVEPRHPSASALDHAQSN